MDGLKILLTIILAINLTFSCSSILAHEYSGHNNDLIELLFGEFKQNMTVQGKQNFDILCRAARLAIDYTSQSFGMDDMDFLRQQGVKNMPALSDIKYTSNQYHQRYTHRGWDFNYYPIDKANWQKRKQLLISAIEKICDFRKNEKIKMEAFAALVYEIHILGDHIGDSEQTRWDRLRLTSVGNSKASIVPPTSEPRFDSNACLLVYMLYHVQRLFREQKNSIFYNQVTIFLFNNCDFFFGRNESEISIQEVKDFAIEVRRNLKLCLPNLLKNEDFFRRAFYN